ncbi:alcohol dehydrogenase catalytic domain-containing protein [Salipaludibacillus sp. LMS25]|jgi:threonine dehydrogenase-like Zn-dependent dehydrogenase|uniref:zinc-dependent alcohol dehydrogenase n=1 Tax=Salipaludibacillus sp. LMS25 TaxID=2924031 RepID=UPI0020D05D12|nr:alcohol dehydrogenase catalytic domain-containing protein [Salipaludibacillus sp. LMS25]UTR14731.1 alcohol dehydrogenase catalytic domain-containing protein [Salipaludibacillus sp. LMS25]
MRAIQFDLSLPKYTFTKGLGRLNRSFYTRGPFTSLNLKDVAKPELPNDSWVEIEILYSGICGSDLNLITLKDSPSMSPFISFPFTLGHEIIGTVSRTGKGVSHLTVGDRVVIDPVLSCESRGITPKCPECQKGNINLCLRVQDGAISPGLMTGTCKDTGGGWSQFAVAHESQLIPVPDSVSHTNAVLAEPFSCALHTVLQMPPKQHDTVFVIGGGVIGICLIAALKALEFKCRIVTLVKYPFQGETAISFGADEVVYYSKENDYVVNAARILGANVFKPVIGERIVHGGADIVYDCVGNERSLHDALRFAKKSGKVGLLGLAGKIANLDMTMVWLNELEIKGTFSSKVEGINGKKTRAIQLAIDLMALNQVDLSPLITHTFPITEYKSAIATAMNKGKEHSMKVLLEPN